MERRIQPRENRVYKKQEESWREVDILILTVFMVSWGPKLKLSKLFPLIVQFTASRIHLHLAVNKISITGQDQAMGVLLVSVRNKASDKHLPSQLLFFTLL